MSEEYELTYKEVVAFSDSQAKTITQKNKRIAELTERVEELEKAVQYAIDTCCLDVEDESVLIDALGKGEL